MSSTSPSGENHPDTPTLADGPFSSLVNRQAQMFPVLSEIDISRIHPFGSVVHFDRGEMLFSAGQIAAGMYLLLSGRVETHSNDGRGRSRLFAKHGPGNFIAEIAQLSGKPALLSARVTADADVIVIPTCKLRALIIAQAELGERIMRAMILRRVGLIEDGRGPILFGHLGEAKLVALEGFLRRNSYPSTVIDVGVDVEGIEFLKSTSVTTHDLPLVLCPDGTLLGAPDTGLLATYLGLLPEFSSSELYDVAIVGAGPAGLATAVYAASEGLSVVMFDQRAPGGQAGASARIENFFGFPTGISGQALTARAFDQAQKFGVHVAIPQTVCGLRRRSSSVEVELSGGKQVFARTVVIATGASYRRPQIPDIERYEGRGIYYWASPVEAKFCRDEEVALVGGGNSAGQAVAYLAEHVKRVHLFVRGRSLDARMSRYLVSRVQAQRNVEIHLSSSIRKLEGDDSGLVGIHFEAENRAGFQHLTSRRLFIFAGADPRTEWLQSSGLSADRHGFLLTSSGGGPRPEVERANRASLETKMEGVFAIGDVRAGSTKRVASAVGDGALVISEIHSYLRSRRPLMC